MHRLESALVVVCLVIALAVWPPAAARAAPGDGCLAGLPASLATQLEPLIRALGEANGQSPDCAASAAATAAAARSDSPSPGQHDLEVIAQTLALLAMADPGYGYADPGYGYAAPACASQAQAP